MFFTHLLIFIALGIVSGILGAIHPILTIIVLLVFAPILLGAQAFFYGKLTEDIPSLEE